MTWLPFNEKDREWLEQVIAAEWAETFALSKASKIEKRREILERCKRFKLVALGISLLASDDSSKQS